MDVTELIKELYRQKEKLVSAIAVLEQLAAERQGKAPHRERTERRGRKSMGPEERRVVSQRMRKYWADRRKQAVREDA